MAHTHLALNAGWVVLGAVLEDVESGYLETVRELAVAEVFSDFLEQADHLFRNGYSAARCVPCRCGPRERTSVTRFTEGYRRQGQRQPVIAQQQDR